ncbi:MAG TPA: glycosyltransferase [Acidimicrobiales bacterium]|nr:glycosyltransferase [Acidimicrobiales bacterium]
MPDRRPVLVYRETLVAASEPFILAQGEGLERHVAWYLALRRAAGHPLPAERSLVWRADGGALGSARRGAWKRWGLAPRTMRAVRALHPAVVHAHFGRDAAQVLPMVDRAGAPLVVTFHGHDVFRTDESLRTGSRSDRLYLERRARLAATGARFLAVSTVVRDRLLELGFPSDRVELHHIGVDVDRIERSAAGVDRDPKLVVFAGRLVPHKGASDLVRALADARLTGVRLAIVGDGPGRREVDALGRALDVRIEHLGFLEQDQVWAWMARAATVVVPSRTAESGWVEAFGLVAAEAQAAGTPVIASRCGGLGEAVAPACRSMMFDEGDVEQLAERLAATFDDPAASDQRGAESRVWVRQHLALAIQNRRLDDLYEEVSPP